MERFACQLYSIMKDTRKLSRLIIEEFDFADKLGCFIMDNASNNDTCLAALAELYGFNKKWRRLRCTGHIINLIARQILFGNDPDAFESELERPKEETEELKLWRMRGPLGKLHNNVVYILISGQQNQVTAFKRRCPGKDFKKLKPTAIDDTLSADDWHVLTQYLEILEPLHVATMELQGNPEEGRAGAIWEVLPVMESLLKHLEDTKRRYADLAASGDSAFLRVNSNLGWKHLNKYYTLTDETPIYLSAVVLHPAYKWRWIERKWRNRPEWVIAGKVAVEELWQQDYRNLLVETPLLSKERKRKAWMALDDDDESLTSSPLIDEYHSWSSQPIDETDPHLENPIQYWLYRRKQYPRLSQMALDLFSIPAMSAEAERIFSLTGLMVTPNRGRLMADIIGATACLRDWDRRGIINLIAEEHGQAAKEAFELIHSNLAGLNTPTGYIGARYYVTFADDLTRLSNVFILKEKSQLMSKLKEFYAWCYAHAGVRIKRIRSQN
ncbi:hypothetical protein B0A49_12989, partial [Cryomyces minteri]